jgi:hypothetical protein
VSSRIDKEKTKRQRETLVAVNRVTNWRPSEKGSAVWRECVPASSTRACSTLRGPTEVATLYNSTASRQSSRLVISNIPKFRFSIYQDGKLYYPHLYYLQALTTSRSSAQGTTIVTIQRPSMLPYKTARWGDLPRDSMNTIDATQQLCCPGPKDPVLTMAARFSCHPLLLRSSASYISSILCSLS